METSPKVRRWVTDCAQADAPTRKNARAERVAERVRERVDMAELSDTDILRVGNINFRVQLPAQFIKRTAQVRSPPLKQGASAPASGRWVTLGSAVLFLAVAVLSATVYWHIEKKRSKETLDGGQLAQVDFDGDRTHQTGIDRQFSPVELEIERPCLPKPRKLNLG